MEAIVLDTVITLVKANKLEDLDIYLSELVYNAYNLGYDCGFYDND